MNMTQNAPYRYPGGLGSLFVATFMACTPNGPLQESSGTPAEHQSIWHSAAGTTTIYLPSRSQGDGKLAIRLRWPASDRTRYPDRAPVVLHVDGGWNGGQLSEETMATLSQLYGFVHISLLLPGGRATDGSVESSGEVDTRGEQSVEAVSTVIEYASDLLLDSEGMRLSERLPFVDQDNIGLYAESNGGNLALAALALEPTSTRWVAFWESPIGDQYATTEINDNPYYQINSCTINGCPLYGMVDTLHFDADGRTQIITDGSPQHLDGVFFLDTDGDLHPDPDERRFSGIPVEEPDGLRIYPSLEFRELLDVNPSQIFNESAPPEWLPSVAEVEAFWSVRDGSLNLSQTAANHPELFVIVNQRKSDHVLTVEDNPHALNHLAMWEATGTFFRLNPDSAYTALVTGLNEPFLPDNPAYAIPEFPTSTQWLMPNEVDGISMTTALQIGSILELSDRTHHGDRTANLSLVLPSP